ncbi:MAG: protein kinase [Deltaproteobacteria bacterium]|nr:protein kinase [Deltaproteobacteria bacterium]
MTAEERSSKNRGGKKPSRELSSGTRIGPYEIERKLGSGGMGEVALAFDRRLGRQVAIKRIRHDSNSSKPDRQRLRREARAVAGLSHPAIVQIYDILTEGDEDSIVMEYVPGQSIAERLRSGPLPLGLTLDLAQQVAEGLSEAHRSHLVHRDLKAENVMMTPRGKAKILDFGLAKRLEKIDIDNTLTQRGVLLGTVRAMSPEQAAGEDVDSRSDLFSLGTLLFEMLFARSPFVGANALETLRNVQSRQPQPVEGLRPELPSEVVQLLYRLLEKDPGKRPQSAQEVIRALDRVRGSLPEEGPRLNWQDPDGSLGDQETSSFDERQEEAPAARFEKASPSPGSPEDRNPSATGRRRVRWLAIAVAVAFVVAAGLWFLSTRPPDRLRVVVLPPEIRGAAPSPELEFAASGALIAVIRTLTTLEGVAPVEPEQIGETSGSPREAAQAVAADEVLRLMLEKRSAGFWISLQRVRGSDGEILWVETFEMPLRQSAARLVAESLEIRLRRAYSERRSRPGIRKLEVRDADYVEFVRISQRIESGQASLEEEMTRLEAISESSPSFLEAKLTAANTALSLHSDTRASEYLKKAEELLLQARQLEPMSSIAIMGQLRLALARNQEEMAQRALAELERERPNSVEVLLAQKSLAIHRGDQDEALAIQQRMVDRWPSWQGLYQLAELQKRAGNIEEARKALDTLIQRSPRNSWGLGKLAQLELLFGDLQRAQELLVRAIEVRPHRSYYTNLGLARFLLGDYAHAEASYREALKLSPDHLTTRLNLADTDLALGNEKEAATGYRNILDSLQGHREKPTERMTVAQCLARLDRHREAIEVTLETLQEHPEHPEVRYQAALVYAIVGETNSALVNVEQALRRGVLPRWFHVPGFEALASNSRFQALISPVEGLP